MVRAMFWSRFQGRRCDAGVAPCSIGMVALKMGPRTLHLEPRGGVAFLPAQVTLAGGENNQTFPETGRADRTDQGKEDMVEAAPMCKGKLARPRCRTTQSPRARPGISHLSSHAHPSCIQTSHTSRQKRSPELTIISYHSRLRLSSPRPDAKMIPPGGSPVCSLRQGEVETINEKKFRRGKRAMVRARADQVLAS